MATPVQLTITVDPAQGIAEIQKFSTAMVSSFARAQASLNQFGSSTSSGTAAMTKFVGVIPTVNKSMETQAQILERARIAGQTFANMLGIQLPRGLDQFLSKSKALAPILNGAFSVLVGGTLINAVVNFAERGIQALVEISKHAEQEREAWIGIDATVQDTTAKILSELDQQKQKYIELTQGPIAGMKFALDSMRSSAISDFQDIAAQMTKMSEQFASNGGLFTVPGRESQAAADQMKKTLADMNQAMHEAAEKNSKDLIAPFKAEQAVLQKAIDDTQTKIAQAQKNLLPGSAPENAFFQDQIDVLQRALSGYQKINSQIGHQIELQKQSNKTAGQAFVEAQQRAFDQVISMRHQFDESQLSGIAQIEQHESAAVDEVIRKEKDKGIAIAEIAEIHREAALKERQAELGIAAAARDTAIFVKQKQAAFLQGSSAIIAQGELEKQSLDNYKGAYITDLGEMYAAWVDHEKRTAAIDQETNQKLIQYHRQLVDRLSDDQASAAIASLPQWQRADAQILLTHKKTYDEINILEAQDQQNHALYEQRKVAADQLANAQMVDAHRQLTEQLGSDLTSLFDDIGSGNLGQRIINNFKKLFAEILAAWILTSTTMKSIFGGIFGTALFGPGSMESQMGGGGGIGAIFGAGAGGGGLLSSFFGGGSQASGAQAPSTAAAGSLAQSLGLGGFFGGNPLSTQSLSDAGIAGGGTAATPGRGLFGGLFSGGAKSLGGIISLSGIAAAMFGGKLGGTTGQIGGLLAGLLMTGQLSGLLSASYGALGLAGTSALFGGGIGGLLGFGIGSQHGGLLGSLSGAGSGALAGFLVGGPIGALIGGLIGAIGGIFGGLFGGHKRKKAAENYFSTQVQPQVQQILNQFEDHQLDFNTAYSDLEQIRQQAQDQLKSLKGEGRKVFRDKVGPAIDAAEHTLNTDEQERNRRLGLVFGPPQFHDGGFVNAALAAWTTKPGELMALLKHGEFVMNPQATAKNRTTLERMNSGQQPYGSGKEVHVHIHAWDGDSMDRWLRNGGAQKISNGLYLHAQEGRS